jgi:hypothetical protein
LVSTEAESFALINGRFSIRDATIYLTSDTASSRINRLFGRNLHRRSVTLALICGLPLAMVTVVLIKNGLLHAALYPALFAVMFLTSPLFYIGVSNPDQIPVCDVQAVIGHPPKKYRSLGHFTVHFVLNGTRTKTSIALPCTDQEGALATFRDAVAVLDRAGIAVVDVSNRTA